MLMMFSFSPPAASFPMHSTSNYFDQQSSTTATTVDAAFDNDTVKAAQNILSLLQESQFAADTEVKIQLKNHFFFIVFFSFFSLNLLWNL